MMMEQGEQKWLYSFAIHPGRRTEMPPYIRQMWSRQSMMQEEEFTEPEFWAFQRELDNAGYELHEVSRVPYVEPETVIV